MKRFTLDKLPKKVLAKLDLETVFMASRIVVAAEKLQLFRKLDKKALTMDELGRRVGIHRRHRPVFFGLLIALGLLKKQGNRYRNSALAEKYFVNHRPIEWTKIYSGHCIGEYKAYSVLEEVLTTGKHHTEILGTKPSDYLKVLASDAVWARDFTWMLYHYHQVEAKAMASKLDLRGYRNLLDVGGGSGVMSIALAQKYPRLKACILDTELVIRATKTIIRKNGLSGRVKAMVGDMHKEIPEGFDVIMLCDVDVTDYTDILKAIYDRLPPGGLVVLAEEFASEDCSEPMRGMLLVLRSKRFWLTTRKQVAAVLKKTGFKHVKGQHLCRDTWMFTGRKTG
jgi:predicted O-methyltransferase YrrM